MPTPGVDIGPFPDIITGNVGDLNAWFDGDQHLDRTGTPAFPSGNPKVNHAGHANRRISALVDIVEWARATAAIITTLQATDASLSAAVTALQNAALHKLIDITKAPYNCVADGSATNDNSTDNYTKLESAIAFCKANPGYGLWVPPGQEFDVYFDTDIFDTTAGKHRYLLIDFPGFRIFGSGLLRGKSKKTFRGRVGSVAGNVLTFQNAGEAANFRATMSLRVSPNVDGSNPRTVAAGSISVEGPVCVQSVNTGANQLTAYELTRIQGVQAGDYVFGDVAFSLFQHEYTSAALTQAWDLTGKDVQLDVEVYGAVVDTNGNANPILDCPTYAINSNPQPMGAGTSKKHRAELDHVRITRGYTQLHFGAGGNLTWARLVLDLKACDIAENSMSGVYFGCNDGFNGRGFHASEDTWFHDLHPTQGSHLTYINSAASLDIVGCRFDGWRSSNFATQHWGGTGTTNYPAYVNWVRNRYGTRSTTSGGGAAILTSEHGYANIAENVIESLSGILLRCSATIHDNTIKPGQTGGIGITTYLDCQHNAQVTISKLRMNLVNIVASGWQGGIIVESPVQMLITETTATATNEIQDNQHVIVPGNTGPFLVIQDGSSGGRVVVDDLEMKFGTASGAGNVSWVASLTGASGAELEMRDVRAQVRPANDRGAIQCQNRTSSDRIILHDLDLTVGTNNSKWFYSTSSLPADVLVATQIKARGAGATFVNRQRVRMRQDVGPDIAITLVTDPAPDIITWDPDYDYAHVTGTTPVGRMDVLGISQIGYHGARVTIYAVSGFSIVAASAAGENFAAAHTLAAGEVAIFLFDATLNAPGDSLTIGRWVRVD